MSHTTVELPFPAPAIYRAWTEESLVKQWLSPNANVNFVQASAYNNMNFAQMSTVAREALIDARKLPTKPGQLVQDIYFFVVPRNMPASVPATTTTTALIHEAAIAHASAVAAPYVADVVRLTRDDPELLRRIQDDFAKQRPGQDIPLRLAAAGDKRITLVRQAMSVAPNADFARIGGLLAIAGNAGRGDAPNDALVHDVVSTVGPGDAAHIVPTLEVYPFYRPAGAATYQPMTSFALFLSHEGTLGGVRYELDGATRIAENVYHLTIPVGFARRIQVRAQALAGAEAALPVGNPAWPCAGGCAGCGGGNRCGLVSQVGNTVPGLIAGVFVIGRRRRRPARR